MKPTSRDASSAEARASRMLRALANPTRFRLVEVLADRKDCTAARLAAVLQLAQSSLSEHLSLLRQAGLVETSGDPPDRPASYYCLDPEAFDFLAAYLGGLGQRARARMESVPSTHAEATMPIRDARPADAAAIARIYNQGIDDRVATLETEPRTPDERAEWLAGHGPRHPVLVAENEESSVVGWGSLNPFNPRRAYDHVVDFSLYVAREERGRGVGDALLRALEVRARALGYHKMVLAAFPTNAPGKRLYERHGFQLVGIYHEQGMLEGRWVDVMLMEKILG